MINLIHGENLVASRIYLSKLKKDYAEVINLSIKDLNNFLQNTPTLNLFVDSSNKKELIVIEGWRKDFAEKILNLNDREVVIWVDKKITDFPHSFKVIEFKENFKDNVFKFADAVTEKNIKKALLILNNLEKEDIPFELLLGILVRQFNLLLFTKEKEAISVPSFVKEKLKKQEGLWEKEELINSLKGLLVLDSRLKTGKPYFKTELTQFIVYSK